jgi:hypothetical protein
VPLSALRINNYDTKERAKKGVSFRFIWVLTYFLTKIIPVFALPFSLHPIQWLFCFAVRIIVAL